MTTQTSAQQPESSGRISPNESASQAEQERQTRKIVVIIVCAAIILIGLLALAVYFLLQPSTPTDKIRDIFIIVVALESLVIGVALIVLIAQLASLINLLQNEVRPILNATSETVNALRGTVQFLGEEVVEPVMKLSGYMAGLKRMLELLGVKPK